MFPNLFFDLLGEADLVYGLTKFVELALVQTHRLTAGSTGDGGETFFHVNPSGKTAI